MTTFLPVFLISIAFAHVLLGIYVVARNPRNRQNQAFCFFSVSAGMWIGGFGLLSATHEPAYASILNVGSISFLCGLFTIAQTFHHPQGKPHSSYWYIPFVFGLLACIYPGVLIRDVIYDGAIPTILPGPYYLYYALWFSTYTIISIVFLLRSYRYSGTEDRARIQYFFLGIGIFAIAMLVSNVLLPAFHITAELYIGPIASLVSLGTKGYAVLKQDLMDIRFVVQRSLVYSILLSGIIGLYAALIIGIDLFFHASVDARTFTAAGITMVAGIFGIPFIERSFRKVTDPIFFKHPYNYSVELERLSEILNANVDVDELIVQSLQELNRILKPKDISFLHRCSGICFGVSGRRNIETLPESAPEMLRVRVESEGIYFGSFLLSQKKSGDRYSQEDQRLLRTFARHATVALHKAELYQELKDHSDLLEERVFERTRHLEDIQEQQRAFFDDLSHALQTPLTVLKSAIGLMGTGSAIPQASLRVNMETSVDHVSQLVRNMLELARIDTLAPVGLYRPFDLSALTNKILEYVGVVAHAQGISVSSDIEEGITFRGELKQIEEAITNILSNAIRYTAGCPVRTVRVILTRKSAFATLCIIDSGIGISNEQLVHIFERFYRSEPTSGKARGFGLGLAIAKRIIERHNGSLAIQSILGTGTTATFSFPLTPEGKVV